MHKNGTTYLSYDRLVTTVQELSLARDLEAVMKIVRVAARELTGADGATFILRDKDSCYYADEDAISPLWKGNRFPMETCISGWVMLNKKHAVIEDIYVDQRIPHAAYRPTFVKSLAMVPIRTMDPIGAIGNYWATNYLPDRSQVNMLQSLADITAVTLENVRVYNELEQRVKDRTAELEAANRELASTNRELETIVYSLSHDLRAPLRNLNLNFDMLISRQRQHFDNPATVLTEKIFKKIGGMNNLIDDLIKLFHMGKKELQHEAVDMNQMVLDVYGELRENESDRKIDFHVESLPSVEADSILIRQVWRNLIGNALKYTRNQDTTVIRVTAQKTDIGTTYCIQDNGTGFDMRYYDKMFTAFQRLHANREFEGSGIGLAIVERIITRLNGKVWAQSIPDNGATFYFNIPD